MARAPCIKAAVRARTQAAFPPRVIVYTTVPRLLRDDKIRGRYVDQNVRIAAREINSTTINPLLSVNYTRVT